MANPQLDKFLKEAAAQKAATQAPAAVKPVAAAPKPPVLAVSPTAPVKAAAAVERSAPSAEPVTPSAEDVKKAEKMRADLLEELPLEDFYKEAARVPLTDIAVESYARKTKLPVDRFTSLAGAQGIDVEDMAQKAREGVPFAEYRRTRDGVIGFKPAAERFTELDRVASDYQTAERGEAPQRTIGIQKAQETTTSLPVFGEGYEVGGTTPDEIIETTKPGEHQYSIAAQFIDSFEKANPDVVSLTDMYGQNAGPGNTQKWIEKYVKMQVRNRGLTAASEDIDEQMGKLRRDAVYYILSKKTIGQWTPGVFVKDVQITDAERAKPLGTGEGFGAGVRDTFAAMAPNVEIVGFNNKGQAVVRQESPAGTALRLLDVLGVSPVGKVKGVPVVIPGQSAISGLITKDKDEGYLEAALRGVQTGATFIDAALDETKGRSTPVRAAAGLAALVPTVLYPDVTGAAEGAYTAAKAYRRVLQDRKIAKAAAPLLDELVAALKAGDYEKATKVESAIRSHPELSKGNHGVMQAQMSMDAQVVEKLKAMNPELASLTPTLGDELITVGVNQSPELAEAIYGEAVKGYPFLHFSKKAPELAARSEKEGIGPTLEAYVNSGDFGRHFQRIERAKAAFLKAAPKNSAEAIDQAVSGLAANLRAKSADVLRLGGAPAADAPRYDRLAKLLEDNKAAIIADPKAAFGKDGVLRQAIKADPVVGADDAREFRAAFYPQAARLSGRIEALKTVDFNTLYQNDLKVFDRAREAVEANIKSRMMAAELLKRELGTRAKINVVPTEILDDLMEPGTERLSAFATAKFIQTMQQLPKAADRKAWLAAFQTMDKMLRGAAELRGVPVDTYWRSIDIRVVDGKPVFVKGEDVVSAPKGPGPLDGFVDVADVQTAVARLRGALAGTDPSYRLKSLLRADGSQAGGEVAVGDVVVRAIRSPQPGAPYRVEVFVGAQQKAAFTSTGKLEDAINEGIDEAQNAMTGRVAAGEPAMREVVVPKPPKTAAQAAAQTSPADAAEEAAAVDSVAATPSAAPLHPKTETVVGGLDPALKADPDVVSRILAAVDKLKAGSKLPPPPKGANKVLMGAVREELLKSGVLVKLDDGSVVKAGTLPEDVKVAPTAAPPAPAPTAAPTAPPVAPTPAATVSVETTIARLVGASAPGAKAEVPAALDRAAADWGAKHSGKDWVIDPKSGVPFPNTPASMWASGAEDPASIRAFGAVEPGILGHGMGRPSSLRTAVADLLGMFQNGLTPGVGLGARYGEPALYTGEINVRADMGQALDTGSAAYRQVPFILVGRPNTTMFTGKLPEVGAVLVNPAHPEIVDELRAAVQRVRPDVQVGLFSEADRVVARMKQAAPTAPPVAPAPAPVASAFPVKAVEPAPATKIDADAPAADRTVRVAPALADEASLQAYNQSIRAQDTGAGISLDRDTLAAGDNIMYRPDRAYRFIGDAGFKDFEATGLVRAKQDTKAGYEVPYFMTGKTSGRYAARRGRPEYVVEMPITSEWRGGGDYVHPPADPKRTDGIRVFKREADGSYTVILDNIGDQALLTQKTAAEAEAPVFQRVAEEVAPPPEETLEELTARLSRDAEDLRAAEIRAEEEFAAAQAERERALAGRIAEDRRAARAREAAPPAEEAAAEPVIQRAPAAEEPLPAVRKAEGFRDKNSVNAGVYEVDIGGKTRRFFRDSKEGFYPRSFVEDVPTSADTPVLPFLGDTIEDAVKALQRMHGAEEAPAAARAAEEVVAEAAPAVERAVEEAPAAAKAEEAGTRTRIQELEAEVERLEPFTTATPKRTNVKKDSFTVEIAGKKIRLENDGDSWLDVATGSELGETADGAVGLLRERLVDYPYARAQRELSSLRRTERAAAETKAAEEAVSAAPTQPSGITTVAEAPVVREEIVAPPAPPVKAEPTVDELQATVARLEPLRDAKIKRTEVSKAGFTAEVAGQQVRVEKRGDNWVNAATGRNLGDNVTEATESLRTEFVLKPYTQAQDALRKLGQVQSTAATVSSLEDALSGVKKIKTQKDALRFFDVAEQLALDANEKAQIYESLAQKLEIMAGQAKSERAAGELETLSIRARDEVTAIRPAAETAPSAVAAAADALTEAQRHVQAVTNMRSLTHRAQVERPDGTFLMFGTAQNGVFTPAFAFRAFEGVKPSEILEVVYDQMRVSPDTMVAARREAEALLEGQTPIVREFPANKYANDADLKFGPGLRQVRPAQAGGPQVVTGAFKPGGGSGLAGTQSIIELAAKTADPTTLLHEGAHFIRKSILDTEDMDNVTAWLNSMGVKVNHEFGEFVGSADDIELAEEMFATAFEKYVVTGKAPTPALERAFELVKNAFAGAYRWMKSDAAKELYGEDALSPQVTAVFNRYFTAVPQKPIESTFDIIVRETRGAKTSDAEGALDVLAREATRKGMPKTAREDLVKKIAALKLSDDVPSETVLLEFPAPVLGKTEWTKGDIIELQAEVVRRRSQMAVVPVRQALFGQPEEEKVTENIYAALAEREEGGLAAGARGIARGMAKLVLGGDIVDERGTRALPEVLRRDLDTPARIIETTIGDSVSVLTQSTRDNDPSFMFRFLAGENLRFKSGRRVLSSGHEHITGFFDLYRNQYASMTREEQALLQEWAQLLNTTPNPENLRNPQTISEALASGAFPQNLMNVRNFADLEAQRKAKANAMVAALEKFIDLGGSGEGNIGGQLRKAIKDAAGEGSQIAFNEYRFAEVLLFLSGSTSRRGVRFLPVDKTFTKDQLVEQARVLLTDAQRIYGGEDDPLFSRRLSILVAAYGSSRRAKAELAALGAVLTAEEAHAFKGWTLGYDISPEMSAQLELVKNKFGLNAKFINETILGDNVYVPAQARARMADALAKAQFNNAKLTPTGDLYQKVWTYMKKRMTRGAFALRQRYFFVNTIDHFNQMYLLVGFAPAAASSARLLLQGLPVNVFGQGYETFIRLANRAGMGDRAAMERFRDLLSRGGDELAARIGSALSVSKYRIDVNDILEGRDKLLLVGGNVYTARQLRDTFVAEGIFSSFDTRRLADGVRMDGNIFARELAQISGSPKSSGTFVDAASRLMDGVQDVTVDVVDDLSDAWAERERVGAVITLMETGVDARAACRVTVDALYDYSQSMTKRDRSFLVGTVLPFWAFQKNANQQFINVMFSPYGAYRMMALQRLREGSVTLASELYYGYIGGELGLDVDNMPQDMQDLYYAIMTRAHEIYGDDLPDNVRIGLRIALTGRVGEVVDGKYYELDTRLIEMMRSGGLAPGGKFGGAGMADYMLAAPNKSGLPSYVRDRFGMVAPQRRNALVRHYTALMGGANEDYFYFMLPESSVETAYKHTATLLGGAFLTAGALSPEWVGIPGVDILAGGADAIGLGDIGRALQPVVDLERSPVMGLALGMYSERGYPQRLHPKVAAALQRMTNIPILRVPAKMDPFMGGTLPDTDEAFRARLEAANAVQDGIVGGTDEAGNPTDLVQILGEDYVRMVQELNSKDLPADVMAVAKEERFYLPPGFMSLSFENSPLGEFNREALRWDQTSKEGADPAGQAAYFTRVLLGTDVVQVAPSRTAQQEEPVRYTKTREPI